MRIFWLIEMDYKICNDCGCRVDVNSNFCPDCGGKSFNNLQTPKVVDSSKPSLIHSLLYWDYEGYFVISKTKFTTIVLFLFFMLMGVVLNNILGAVIVGSIVCLVVFCIGFLIHKLLPKPSQFRLKYNDYGLLVDLKHFLLFWQNKNTGEFVLSKTKIISHLIFIAFALYDALVLIPENLVISILIGLIFEIPAFLIGYGIHKLTNPNPTNPKKVISKPKEVPKTKEVPKPKATPKVITSDNQTNSEFEAFEKQIDDLEREFTSKEANVRNLIEKRFKPPQLTYTKFISVVDKSSELFKNQVEASRTIINLSSDCSPKIENELNSKIDVLKTIIDKLDDLTNELVLVEDKSQDGDIHELFDDMEDLIKSIKDYE